jgi:hypothetical protein
MTDPSAFDFTESEIYAALRLGASEEEARRGAREFVRAYTPGMDWGMSERTLLLLSLATESGNERVERIRRAMQEDRYSDWRLEADTRHRRSAGELSRAWADHLAIEDRE